MSRGQRRQAHLLSKVEKVIKVGQEYTSHSIVMKMKEHGMSNVPTARRLGFYLAKAPVFQNRFTRLAVNGAVRVDGDNRARYLCVEPKEDRA